MRSAGVAQACHNFLISQTGFQHEPGFWITMVGFRIPLAGFRIPKPWIPDSTDQNYLDSGFRITLHGAINSAHFLQTLLNLRWVIYLTRLGTNSRLRNDETTLTTKEPHTILTQTKYSTRGMSNATVHRSRGAQ